MVSRFRQKIVRKCEIAAFRTVDGGQRHIVLQSRGFKLLKTGRKIERGQRLVVLCLRRPESIIRNSGNALGHRDSFKSRARIADRIAHIAAHNQLFQALAIIEQLIANFGHAPRNHGLRNTRAAESKPLERSHAFGDNELARKIRAASKRTITNGLQRAGEHDGFNVAAAVIRARSDSGNAFGDGEHAVFIDNRGARKHFDDFLASIGALDNSTVFQRISATFGERDSSYAISDNAAIEFGQRRREVDSGQSLQIANATAKNACHAFGERDGGQIRAPAECRIVI